MTSFLTQHGVLVALVCAAAAIVYGVLTSRQLLALSPGTERMQAISAAVQEGARAYLNRQYTTIAAAAHTSATRTPCCVRKLVKKVLRAALY